MEQPSEFERAGEQETPGFFSDLWHFLKHNKKWWLLPIVAALLALALLALLSGTAMAPFIYTLF